MDLKKFVYHVKCDVCGSPACVCIAGEQQDFPQPQITICRTCIAALNSTMFNEASNSNVEQK